MANNCSNKSASRKWEEMDSNILVKIFMTFSLMDIATCASMVCKSWHAASRDAFLWNTIDFSMFSLSSSKTQHEQQTVTEGQQCLKLLKMLRCALTLSRNNVTGLILDFNVYINNDHLLLAAERCPNLRQLVIPAWDRITLPGVCKAIKILKGLQSLTLPCMEYPATILGVIGTSCKNLIELKLMCPFDHNLAAPLCFHLPKLKVLSLRCCVVNRDALSFVLHMLSDLEKLNISHTIIADGHSSKGPVTVHWEPDPIEYWERITKLRQLLTCQDQKCSTCKYMCENYGSVNWHDCNEALWKQDEITSLAV